MEGDKYIFLDVDGVLNDEADLYRLSQHEEEAPTGGLSHLRELRRIVDATDAKVVLSSSWRISVRGTDDVMASLAMVGLHLDGLTPEGAPVEFIRRKYPDVVLRDTRKSPWDNFEERTDDRGAEIASWLHARGGCSNYVVLDDDVHDILPYHKGHVVQTSYANGLDATKADEAIRILNGNE